MNRRAIRPAWLATSLLLGLPFMACASDTTDPDARSADQEVQPNAEIPAEIGEAAQATPTRDLDQLERELADNRAKLRQLGVVIATTTVDGEPEPDPEPAMAEATEEKTTGRTTSRNKDRKTGKAKQDKDKNATTGGVVAPSSPKPGTASGGGSSGLIPEGDAVAEPAKSVQAPPTVLPTEQGEEERCPLICSLADGTCELTDEICELADRHTDDDAYLLACERASTDCKQAREACLECLG